MIFLPPVCACRESGFVENLVPGRSPKLVSDRGSASGSARVGFGEVFPFTPVRTSRSAVKTPPKSAVKTPPDQNIAVKTCRPPSKYCVILMGGGPSWFLLSKHEICCENVEICCGNVYAKGVE